MNLRSSSESELWRWLHRKAGHRHDTFFSRMENRIQTGVPDVIYCMNGKAGWIELKLVRKIKRGDFVDVGLRSDQALWLFLWKSSGGRAFVLVEWPEGLSLIQDDYLRLVGNKIPAKVLRDTILVNEEQLFQLLSL